MITKMRVIEIDAKKTQDAKTHGFDVQFNLENVKVEKNEIKLEFLYTVNYSGNAASIKIRGEIIAKENEETIKKIEEGLKTKKLPAEYMQKTVNAINYFGTTNATVIATVMNIFPPIKLPVLRFKQIGETAKEAEKKENAK